MQWRNLVILLIIGVLLGAGNLWYAAVRSTIPLGIQDRVARVELRREKHRGKDDVYLVHFASGAITHVDEAVARELSEGCVLQKAAWQKQLNIRSTDSLTSQKSINLEWSADVVGMFWAMPLVLLILHLTGITVGLCQRERRKSLTHFGH